MTDMTPTPEPPKGYAEAMDDLLSTAFPLSPVAGKEETEPQCTCADWGMMGHTQGCAVTLWANRNTPANAAEVGPSGQPDGGAESPDAGNDSPASILRRDELKRLERKAEGRF
jgi:hypothetical protein